MELDSSEKERVFRELGSAVESKFQRVGFGYAESIDELLKNLWSSHLCILFYYLIMTGVSLEKHACQTRSRAPQNHSPRDIHTLTTFGCHRLSFVADFRLGGNWVPPVTPHLDSEGTCGFDTWAHNFQPDIRRAYQPRGSLRSRPVTAHYLLLHDGSAGLTLFFRDIVKERIPPPA